MRVSLLLSLIQLPGHQGGLILNLLITSPVNKNFTGL